MLLIACLSALLLILSGLAPRAWADNGLRTHGGRYTAERIANLRANSERFEWAGAECRQAVARAASWLEIDDDTLWRMVPGQKLPRTIDVSMYQGQRPGCPACGHGIDRFGNYPYRPDFNELPWKLTCPNCQVIFPTNDFGAYYTSGIDESGVFDPEKADRSLLFHAEHPDPDDPLHTYGVDDGFGWFDDTGQRYLFIGYYTWRYWMWLRDGVTALARAYLYTGEQHYARKALIMLDRIADLYPEYDYYEPYGRLGYYHSHGNTGRGKIEGCIWETGVVLEFATAVDMVLSGSVDNPDLYAFLSAKEKQYRLPRPKGTRELLVQNIDDGILREGAGAIYDGRARGNEGFNQRALAACAIALDTNPDTEKWLDYLFEPQGEHLPGVIVGGIDRDGVGAEGAPSYSLNWGVAIGDAADLLADYTKYTNNDVYRDYPQFRQTFTAGWRMAILGYATPNIGDCGAVGSIGIIGASPAFIIRGYRYLGDPEIALAAWYANGEKADGLGRDIFSDDPERIAREVAEIAAGQTGNPFIGGRHMAGYGLASLEFGWGKEGTGLWMYYGRNGGHGHLDRLNFDIYYKGLCMLPDHGYPEYATTWPQRNYFTNNTISHNTMVVDESPQATNWVGHPELFVQCDDFGAVRVESTEVYPQTDLYQRTLAFVKVGEGQAYAFDVFRVRGGDDHVYSLHGMPGEVTTGGLQLVPQPEGTYHGPQTPFGAQTPPGRKYGYSWLGNVERDDNPPKGFTVDWKGQVGWRGIAEGDNIHVRYHSLSELDDIALADGEPPQNKAGNPRWLRYLLARRHGDNLRSVFTGIIEPYTDTPAIREARRLAVSGENGDNMAVAVRVTLEDGTEDYLVSSNDDTAVLTVENGPTFSGGIGWLRVRDGVVHSAVLGRGTRLAWGDFVVSTEKPYYSGTVVRMDREMAGSGCVWVDTPLPEGDTLKGHEIIIANDRERNACYTIHSVEREGDLWKVDLGGMTFVRRFADPRDYSKGFIYNFEEGSPFTIPLAVQVQRSAEGQYLVKAAVTVHVEVPGE